MINSLPGGSRNFLQEFVRSTSHLAPEVCGVWLEEAPPLKKAGCAPDSMYPPIILFPEVAAVKEDWREAARGGRECFWMSCQDRLRSNRTTKTRRIDQETAM